MSTVAVVAHAGKTLGGGLLELRRELERQGVSDPLWYEVPKSRKAPKRVREALDELGEFYQQFGDRMPPAIWNAHAETTHRFGL